MNLIPPISTAPVVPLPGNGLEPGDNPLAGVEGPVFYDEFLAALAKGAGGEGGAELSGSTGETVVPEGETPQGDLQGLPAEVTSQLVDQANFSPAVLQQTTSITGGALEPAEEGLTLGRKSSLEVVTDVVAQSSPQSAVATVATQQIAEGASSTQEQEVVTFAVGPLTKSATTISKPSEAEISNRENLQAGTKSVKPATVEAETDDAPSVPTEVVATNPASGSDQSVEVPSVKIRKAVSDQTARDATASVTTNRKMLSSSSADLSGQRVSVAFDVSEPVSISQPVPAGSSDAPTQLVTATNLPRRVKGVMPSDVDLGVSSPSASINLSGISEAPSVESDFGLRASGTPQSVVRSEDWQGLIPSQTAANRAVVSFGGASDSANPDGSADLSMMSAGGQIPVATDEFGGWRFSVRPNSANPVDNVALPADVSVQLETGSAPIVKPISNLASDESRVMTNDSDLKLDPSTRSPAWDAVIDSASAESSRIASDKTVEAIASQTASAQSRASTEGRASLDGAMSDIASATTAREMPSGSSNSVAEKFVSTLLGMSGMQPESAADRTSIEFRQAKTIVAAPHMARWDAAAVQIELVRLVRDGGGQIVMKLTPPDEGSFRIDLSLDPERGVRIFVEGASDSVRTRLEQGAEQLREQFSQMGFNLQLDMHSRREASGQSAEFGFTESGDLGDSGGGRTAASEAGAEVEDSPAARRRSIIDESRVYFRA